MGLPSPFDADELGRGLSDRELSVMALLAAKHNHDSIAELRRADAYRRRWLAAGCGVLLFVVSMVGADLYGVMKPGILDGVAAVYAKITGDEGSKTEEAFARAYRSFAPDTEPDRKDIEYWADRATEDGMGQTLATFISEPEPASLLAGMGCADPTRFVEWAYEVLFDRLPDVEAHDWIAQLERGASQTAVVISMARAPEWSDR